MIWFATLLGFWLAFVTAGLISAVLVTFILTRFSAKFFGCIPFFLFAATSYLVIFGLTYALVPQEYWNPTYDPKELELDEFVRDMSPSLFQKIEQLETKQTETAEKIQKLKKLKKDRPNFAEQINVEIAKWEELNASIKKTLDRIHDQTEKALVDYQIDEISGRERFSNVSRDLQDEAVRVLDLAGVLQASIEEQSTKKNAKEDESDSLEDLLNEIEKEQMP